MWDRRSWPWYRVAESPKVPALPTAASDRREGGGEILSIALVVPSTLRARGTSARHLVPLPGVLSSHHWS